MSEKNYEYVDHPRHYNRDGAMECIDEMILLYGKKETAIFCKLTAHRYRYRAGSKPGEEAMKDLKKSDWYMNKYKELTQSDDATKVSSCISYNSIAPKCGDAIYA